MSVRESAREGLRPVGRGADGGEDETVRLGEAVLLPKLGPQANEGDVVYILIADAHEHLGQLIAYARQNGIVPPWTVQMQKKKAAAAAGK
jgi:hypothetical protein